MIPNIAFNTSNNHPIIPNSQDCIIYKKYVSIHSEDRDSVKYPSSSQFEVEMPEDITNVFSLRLINWTFPANYNTFSALNQNVGMTFLITNPYNPHANHVHNPLEEAIYVCLTLTAQTPFIIIIEDGFYNPDQMVLELQNKFNAVVSDHIIRYFKDRGMPLLLEAFVKMGGYTKFVMAYNAVSQKIWFGNQSDAFTLTNELSVVKDALSENVSCANAGGSVLPEYAQWGLPSNLGLQRKNTDAVTQTNPITGDPFLPRFFYGDVHPGDDGYWLLPVPGLTNSVVYFVECAFKINLMGEAYFYMELAGNNAIDETSPFNLSTFTTTTNITNGVVNASFAKLGVPTTPVSQWFDRDSLPYKMYWPPADRIRKLNIKIRYHNGQLAQFGVFPFSFMIEFTQLLPHQNRQVNPINFKFR